MPHESKPDITEPDRFRHTRRAHRDETAEDYVEAVTQLIEVNGEARVGTLAQVMGVSHVTVTRIIARLANEGLVTTQPRKPIDLTSAGREMARNSIEKHLVVLGFLIAIGVDERQAQIDAEGIEHHVSQETLSALRRVSDMLSNPKSVDS